MFDGVTTIDNVPLSPIRNVFDLSDFKVNSRVNQRRIAFALSSSSRTFANSLVPVIRRRNEPPDDNCSYHLQRQLCWPPARVCTTTSPPLTLRSCSVRRTGSKGF